MSKTFTCKELGGICDEAFSGDTLDEIIQKGMGHMGIDEAHKSKIANLETDSGENKQQWYARMQQEFETKPEDN